MSSSGYKEERIGQRDQIRKSTVLHPTGSHLPATRVWPLALALVKPASGLGSLFTTWHWHRQDEGGNSEEAFGTLEVSLLDTAVPPSCPRSVQRKYFHYEKEVQEEAMDWLNPGDPCSQSHLKWGPEKPTPQLPRQWPGEAGEEMGDAAG